MLRHPASQVELLKADIDRLRDARQAAITRHGLAETAKHQSEEAVYQADAQMTSAAVDAEVLLMQIDEQLEALAALLPKPRPV